MQEALEQAIIIARGIWRYRWYAMVIVWVAAVSGWIFIAKMPDVYESKAQVYVDTDNMLRPLLKGITVQTNVDQRVRLMTRTLLSRPNLEKVARMTDLDLKAQNPKSMDSLINKLQSNTKIQSTHKTNLYTISYQDNNPEITKRIVQAFITIFVESTLGDSRRDTDSAQKFLDKQIKEYEARLVAAEDRLKEFKRRNVGLMPSDGKGYYERLEATKNDLATAELELREVQKRRNELRRQLGGEEPVFGLGAASTGGYASRHHPLDDRINALRNRLDDLLLRYTAEHPDVIAIRDTLASLEAQKKRELGQMKGEALPSPSVESNPVYQQLKIDLAGAEATVGSLTVRVKEYQERVARLQKMVDTVPEIEAQLKRLNRDYEVTKKNYDALLSRRESAKLSEEVDQTGDEFKFEVVDPPRVPLTATGPNRLMFATAVLFASIGAGSIIAFVLSQIRPMVYDRRTLRDIAGYPVFGVVSRVITPEILYKKRLERGAFAAACVILVLVYGGVLMLYVGNAGSAVDFL